MENRLIQKIPLNPPLPKGEDARKDSRQAGMTDKFGLTYEILSKELQRFKSLSKVLPTILRYLRNKKRISKRRKIWHDISDENKHWNP